MQNRNLCDVSSTEIRFMANVICWKRSLRIEDLSVNDIEQNFFID
jgi:hypothetical protein